MMTKALEIHLPGGLEARSMAELVQLANRFTSAIYIQSAAAKINAKSMMGMMSLSTGNGEEVTVSADGEDEADAIEEITRFLSR